MITLNSYLVHAPEVVGQLLADEAVLLLPHEGQVKVLNAVGARIWELLDGTRTLATVRDLLSIEYAVDRAECERDLLAFARDLLGRGVLQVKDAHE